MLNKQIKLIHLLTAFALAFGGSTVFAEAEQEAAEILINEEGKLEQVLDESQVKQEQTLSKEINKDDAQKLSGVPEGVFIDITADQIRYNEENNYFEAIGNAQTYMPDKDATLYADLITFDGESKLVEATGKVKVVRVDETISGSYASFKADSREYIMQNPRIFLRGLKLKARVSRSTLNNPKTKKKNEKDIILFQDGVVALQSPKSLYFSGRVPPTRYSQIEKKFNKRRKVEWEDLPDESAFKYSAENIIYDDTKKINNLRIEGARVWLSEKLSIPAPIALTTTVGESANSQFLGPIFGTRTRLGGFVMGPRFYKSIDKGTFALAPVLQVGNSFNFGAGAIGSFNTPGDKTAILGGYGSLEDRFIANVHQALPWGFETNYLFNQFQRGGSLGTTQVGQLAEIAHVGKIRSLPFIDEAFGLRIRNSVGFAQDNDELFADRRLKDLKQARGNGRNSTNFEEDNSDFRTDTYVSLYTNPIVRKGNEFYNMSIRGRAQNALRFYGSGNIYNVGRFGPSIETTIKSLKFEVAYLAAVVAGDSPFLFDQFVGGNQAIVFDGDYKVSDWLRIGAFANFNLSDDRFTSTQIRTDFGPEDFKFRFSYDTIRNQVAFGLNMIFGDPIEYDDLIVKI